MAVRTNEEIINTIKARLGDDVSDDALTLLEDVTDTLADYSRRVADSGDWERRYNDNDAAWRKRYRERFENAPSVEVPTDIVEFIPEETETIVEESEEAPQTYDDLFEYK